METVADVLVRALWRHGVREVFGQSLPTLFFLAAERQGMRQITYRTENAGGAMADGFARVSHRLAVVGAQNGPAATLLVPPLSEALQASVPILAIVQDVPAWARDRNAFQELDHTALFASCAKWVRQLTDPSRADDYLDMAVAAATSGRPGPAVLLLPKDVLAAEVPALTNVRSPVRRSAMGSYPLDRTRPEASAVEQAAQLLARAVRPVIVAGGGVHLSDASQALADLQDVASLPVATTMMGKGSVDESHPLSIGLVGYTMGRYGVSHHLRDLVSDADVVLLVGTRTNENGTDGWTIFSPDATFVHVDIDGGEVGRTYEAVRLVGDARLALTDLSAALVRIGLQQRSAARRRLADRIAEGRQHHRDEAVEVTRSQAVPVRPERVVTELDALIDPDTVVVSDASYSTIWMANYLRARQAGQRFISPRGMAGLGWGLPMALGAQVARPNAQVVCLTGDGGFGHVWAELETAVRENLPVTIVLFNNSVLGYQKHSELNQFGEHTSAIDFVPVDHSAIASAVGMQTYRVTRAEEVGAALELALGTRRPVLVEVLSDPDAYPPITRWDGREATILEHPALPPTAPMPEPDQSTSDLVSAAGSPGHKE